MSPVFHGHKEYRMTSRWVIVLAIGLLAGAACAQEASAHKRDKAFSSEKEKVSYALGVNLAKQLQSQAIEVDPESVTRGLRDMLAGTTILNEQEVRSVVSDLARQAKAKLAALQREKMRARAEFGTQGARGGLAVSFKLDPRLATGTYGGGDRWVAPPTYTRFGDGKTCTIEARVRALDPTGQPATLNPKWIAADPSMVTVAPDDGTDVNILVHRPGETTVRISSGGLSKELAIKAEYQNSVLLVSIASK
jgi:hypothetical protein